MLIVKAFPLYYPEGLKILLIQGFLDLLPVDVGFRRAHFALYLETPAVLLRALFKALQDLLALLQGQLLYMGKGRFLGAAFPMAGFRQAAGARYPAVLYLRIK